MIIVAYRVEYRPIEKKLYCGTLWYLAIVLIVVVNMEVPTLRIGFYPSVAAKEDNFVERILVC